MKRQIIFVMVCLTAVSVLWGCKAGNTGAVETDETSAAQEEVKMTAMVVPYGEDGFYLFVDQETQTPFHITTDRAEIRKLDGSIGKMEDLNRGDLVEIYGDGIMLESYPGQYPGATRIQVIQEGEDTDADPYDELILEIYPPADPSQPPFADVEYETQDAYVTAAADRIGYIWSFTDENGETTTVTTDAPPLAEIEDLNDITLADAQEVEMNFSHPVKSVAVERYQETDVKKVQSEEMQQEEIKPEQVASKTDDGETSFTAEPGYRYKVRAVFENGEAEYGFKVDELLS